MEKNNIERLENKLRKEVNQIMCMMTHIFDALERSVDSEALLALNNGNSSPLQVT